MPSRKSAIANRPRRILIRSTNWIGDCVMTMPAVQRLREWEPHAHLALLCPAKVAALWRHNPFLNEVITFTDRPDLAALRQRDFDIAVLFPNSFRAAWEARRAGIPIRVGYPGHRRRWLLTEVVPPRHGEQPVRQTIEEAGQRFEVKRFPVVRHQVHHYLDLVGHLGGNHEVVPPKIFLAHEELPQLTKFFHDDGLPCLGINAGAEYGPAKRWPAERFARVAERIAEHHDCRWIIFGGPGDVAIAAEIEEHLRRADIPTKEIVNVAGQTTLHELFLLLKMCVVLVTNDTGPMHIAAALGTPLVAIFGSTSPELTGPLGPQAVVVREAVACSPCFLRECPIDFRCMQRVTEERVADAILKLCGGLTPEGTAVLGAPRRLRAGWHFRP